MIYTNGNSDDLILVLITPKEYDDFLSFLKDKGYRYNSGSLPGDKISILEQVYNYLNNTTYTISIKDKKLGYFPMEIYQRNSPTYDIDRFNFYYNQIISCKEAKEKILNAS